MGLNTWKKFKDFDKDGKFTVNKVTMRVQGTEKDNLEWMYISEANTVQGHEISNGRRLKRTILIS